MASDSDNIVGEIGQRMERAFKPVPIGVSNRHLHLTKEDFKTLFGSEAEPTLYRQLRQPGFFACNETVVLETEKGALKNVRMIGPYRTKTQVELSMGDSVKMGLKPPVRDSGSLDSTPGIKITGPKGSVMLKGGVILSKRHIHFTPEDAKNFGIADKQIVRVRCGAGGERTAVFEQVLCRVSDKFALELHLDVEEANAAMVGNNDSAYIV